MDNVGQLSVYRGCAPVVDAEYKVGSGQSPVEAVTAALAAAAGVDVSELPSLYDYVDTDALNALFERRGRGTDEETILSFQVDAWNVFIGSYGRIRVCDSTQAVDPEPVFESTMHNTAHKR